MLARKKALLTSRMRRRQGVCVNISGLVCWSTSPARSANNQVHHIWEKVPSTLNRNNLLGTSWLGAK